jgi:hypothetical protein
MLAAGGDFFRSSVGAALGIKGGTSLSKVFHAIRRFSEDIDLSVSPELLGQAEGDLDDAPSRSLRQKRFKQLQEECKRVVSHQLQDDLEGGIRKRLGERPDGSSWFRYEVDTRTDSPVLWFEYDSTVSGTGSGGYIVSYWPSSSSSVH